MSEKKGFVRKNPTQTEDLEKVAEQLNTTTSKAKATEKGSDKMYSYSIKLDQDLENRVAAAAKKHRYTKKGFFLLAIEKLLEQLEK